MKKPKGGIGQILLIVVALVGAVGLLIVLNRANEHATNSSITIEKDDDHDH